MIDGTFFSGTFGLGEANPGVKMANPCKRKHHIKQGGHFNVEVAFLGGCYFLHSTKTKCEDRSGYARLVSRSDLDFENGKTQKVFHCLKQVAVGRLIFTVYIL